MQCIMCHPSHPQQVTHVNFIAMYCIIHTCCQSRCFLTAKWGSELLLVLILDLFPFSWSPWVTFNKIYTKKGLCNWMIEMFLWNVLCWNNRLLMFQKIVSSIHCLKVSPWLLYLTLFKFAFLYSHLLNAFTSLLCLSNTQLSVHHITIAKVFFVRTSKAYHFRATLTHTKVHKSMTRFVNPLGTYCFFFLLLLGSPSPMQDELFSPQHPGSPFPDAFLSSTSCTSAPLSPPLLDLGVDIQAELEREAPDLDFALLDPQGKMDLVFLFHSALYLLTPTLFWLASPCFLLHCNLLILILTLCTPIKD